MVDDGRQINGRNNQILVATCVSDGEKNRKLKKDDLNFDFINFHLSGHMMTMQM